MINIACTHTRRATTTARRPHKISHTHNMSPPPGLQVLPAWRVVLHGDFAHTISTVGAAPAAVTQLPHRQVFFLADRSLASEALTSRDLRDRNDEAMSCPGIVGATGDAWMRQRGQLRVLQNRDNLVHLAAPAVHKALNGLTVRGTSVHPADAFVYLEPPALLQYFSALTRAALYDIIGLSAAAAAIEDGGGAARSSNGGGMRRTALAAAMGAWVVPGSAAFQRAVSRAYERWVLRRAAALVLLVEQAAAALVCGRTGGGRGGGGGGGGGVGFFALAQLFTAKSRKLERRVEWVRRRPAELARFARRAVPWRRGHGGAGAGRRGDWVAEEVERRWRLRRQEEEKEEAAGSMCDGGVAPPADLLESLLAPSAPPPAAPAAPTPSPSSSSSASSAPTSSSPAPPPPSPPSPPPSPPPSALTLSETTDVVRDVMTAGGETTAAALSPAVVLLRAHPAAARRVAAEGRRAGLGVADGGEGEGGGEAAARRTMQRALAEPSALAFTNAVLLEAMRLYPPAPLLLRVALRDTTLGGRKGGGGGGGGGGERLVVPAGSGVVASTYHLGRTPTDWERPGDFWPERFLSASADDGDAGGDGAAAPSVDAAAAAAAAARQVRDGDARRRLLAFGAGPRSCVGQQLALSLASLALATILADASREGALGEAEEAEDEEEEEEALQRL